MAFAVNLKSFHIFLTSDGCLKRFPQNKPNDFRIGLQTEKVLGNSQRWSVGIQNVHFDSDLFNLGRGTGVSFVFLYNGVYHIVNPASAFVSSPSEAVDALNRAMRKYCGDNKKFFQDSSKKPTFDVNESARLDQKFESDFRFYHNPSFEGEWRAELPSQEAEDKDFDESLDSFNEISTALRRNKADQVGDFQRSGSVDSVKSISEGGREKGRLKRGVSEEPKPRHSRASEDLKVIDPEMLIKFSVNKDSGKIAIRIGEVQDFGMSQMLRFMLGFHSSKKVFLENFEFRKRCREFMRAMRRNFDIVSLIQKNAMMLHPTRIKSSRPEDRERLYLTEIAGCGYEFFIQRYGDLLESTLKHLISDNEADYLWFVEKSYFPSRRGSFETPVRKYFVPFSVYSIIDFIYYVVAWKGIDGQQSDKKLLLKSDGSFRPHIFDRLYIYSDIVKPVDYDDRQIRLMDIVFLQPKTGGNYGVVDYRSVVFQEVDVDVLKDIHIIVTTSLGSPAPFMHGPMCLTLLFRKES